MLSLVPVIRAAIIVAVRASRSGLIGSSGRLRAQVVPGSSSGHLLMCSGRCDGVRRGRGIKFVAHSQTTPVEPAAAVQDGMPSVRATSVGVNRSQATSNSTSRSFIRQRSEGSSQTG